MKTYTVSWILDSYKGNSLTKREALALIGDRVEVCKSDESMIQKELRGDNYDRWRHSTKPHMPQDASYYLPNPSISRTPYSKNNKNGFQNK